MDVCELLDFRDYSMDEDDDEKKNCIQERFRKG